MKINNRDYVPATALGLSEKQANLLVEQQRLTRYVVNGEALYDQKAFQELNTPEARVAILEERNAELESRLTALEQVLRPVSTQCTSEKFRYYPASNPALEAAWRSEGYLPSDQAADKVGVARGTVGRLLTARRIRCIGVGRNPSRLVRRWAHVEDLRAYKDNVLPTTRKKAQRMISSRQPMLTLWSDPTKHTS